MNFLAKTWKKSYNKRIRAAKGAPTRQDTLRKQLNTKLRKLKTDDNVLLLKTEQPQAHKHEIDQYLASFALD